VLCPDKDADGLSSGLIVYRTLLLLGLPEECLHLHFLSKGQSIHGDVERARLEMTIRGLFPYAAEEQEAAIIIVDQASRPARPIVRSRSEEGCGSMVTVKTLIMDHHQATEWPEEAVYVTACRSSPICTSSLLVYLLCTPLHDEVPSICAWLALVGIFGDLGPSEIKFGDESGVWPVTREMLVLKDEVKEQGKKSISDAVGMLNARGSTVSFCAIWADLFVRQARRTAEFNGRLALHHTRRLTRTVAVSDAWDALYKAKRCESILSNQILDDCRFRVSQEVERCTHAAPRFSKDGRVALLRINSGFQVHPVIVRAAIPLAAP
jgi:hypothetical protein